MAYLTVDDKAVFREQGYVIKRDVGDARSDGGRARCDLGSFACGSQ